MIEMKVVSPLLQEMPYYATPASAGIDLYACVERPITILPGHYAMIGSGIALNMMPNQSFESEICAGILLPRSGKATKEGLVLANTIGLIDQDYQGEIMIAALNRNRVDPVRVDPLERIAQLMLIPVMRPQIRLVDEEFTAVTSRGEGGFGSTGTN